MGARNSSHSIALISLGFSLTVFTEASSITWKNTSVGKGVLRAVAFASSSVLTFLLLSI
jgi:hypothetical protein